MSDAPDSPALPRPARAALMLIIGICVLAPLPVTILPEYGDADAAWDAIVAMLWARHDHLPTETGVFVQERFRSSPLTIWTVRMLDRFRLIDSSRLPWVMNLVTLAAGLILPFITVILLTRLRGRAEALVAAALLMSSPVLFRLRCYGLPTLPAFTLFVGVALAVAKARTSLRAGPWLALAGLLLVLAVLVKVDVILLSPALIAIGWRSSRRWLPAIAGAGLPLIALLAWHLFCRMAAPGAPETTTSFQTWSGKWMLMPRGLIDRANLLNMIMAPGIGTTVALILTLIAAARSSLHRWLLAVTFLCILPTVLFWGMREMNSSRHNFWIVAPLAFLIAAALIRLLPRRPGLLLAVVVAICLANYLLGPRQEDFRLAPARFVEAARDRAATVHHYHCQYDTLFESPPAKRLCLKSRRLGTAHALAAFIARSDRCDVRVTGSRQDDWLAHAWRGPEEFWLWIPDPGSPLSRPAPLLESQDWIHVEGD